MITAIVITVFLLVIAFDYVPMHKDVKTKETVWYFIILGVSFCVLILYSFQINVPSPAKGIESVLDKLFPTLAQ